MIVVSTKLGGGSEVSARFAAYVRPIQVHLSSEAGDPSCLYLVRSKRERGVVPVDLRSVSCQTILVSFLLFLRSFVTRFLYESGAAGRVGNFFKFSWHPNSKCILYCEPNAPCYFRAREHEGSDVPIVLTMHLRVELHADGTRKMR